MEVKILEGDGVASAYFQGNNKQYLKSTWDFFLNLMPAFK
jgi:hypothetical protein